MNEALEASTQEVEVIDPLTDNSHIQIKDFKDREIETKTAIAAGHSMIISSTDHIEGELVQTLINQEGTLAVDLITTLMLIDSINIICMNSKQSNMAPPCSLCGGYNHSPKHCYKGEHDINNIMEKMSINPYQQNQGNLYQ